ncbi:PIG-L deacetylase family protein [Rhodococcus sp. IEGM 1408]|uniref:PIG-L deacetylase family protein n=1 Tax=Rhodococcus sp. IEGM 1408 TaxID=3082220 RepID=UPI002954727F|nr:PIG-L family deacetylase [Rhodococcus sp. IEGM 1408]MDV8002541.1 PIG-L family deacetylase [Rhodococcus sp. IEGM 1408]
MIPLLASVREVVVIGAHCDDIAIGMGGTLFELCAAVPDLRVRALVLTGAGTPREDEERAALSALLPGADLEITVLDFRDGRLPADWDKVKDAVALFARTADPDVVFAPNRSDAHQDHRLLAEVAPTEFRDHLILGYEILKWETDTPAPSVFLPFGPDTAEHKRRILLEHYPSQHAHDWFGDGDSFVALSRLRGVQCRAPHAEAFILEKATLTFTKELTCVS